MDVNNPLKMVLLGIDPYPYLKTHPRNGDLYKMILTRQNKEFYGDFTSFNQQKWGFSNSYNYPDSLTRTIYDLCAESGIFHDIGDLRRASKVQLMVDAWAILKQLFFE